MNYGLSGELLTLNNETRQYNSRLQLTNITVSGGTLNIDYRYSPNQNNGQITQQKDWISGEEVTYTYDSLQRLIGAVTTDPSWGQSFTYDGFGNRTSATVTKGSATHGNWNYDPNTNRLVGNGYGYDANGNSLDVGSYDVENRLVSVPTAYNWDTQLQTELYAYAPDNKRIWKKRADGTEELYFYGISGQHLGTYNPTWVPAGYLGAAINTSLYFGSRAIISKGVYMFPDRLGSNRPAGGSRFFPYGEEQQVTAQDRDKFATYYRDGTTGLDYAQNRYYASTLGRFTSPDPYQGSAGPSDPGSWNRYAYASSDPVNRIDPSGQSDCLASGEGDSECVGPQDCPFGYIWSSFGGSCQPQGGGYPTCIAGYSFSPTFGDCEPDGGSGGQQPQPQCSIELWQRPAFVKGNPGHHTYILFDDPNLPGAQWFDLTEPEGMVEGGPVNGKQTGFVSVPGEGLGSGTSHASDPSLKNNHEIGSAYTGQNACSDIATILSNVRSYNNGPRVPYYALGNYNSNSFTSTLLGDVGLSGFFGILPTFSVTGVFYPGWAQTVPGL